MTKSIKIATGLTRRIELSTERANAINVWEIIKEHRGMLIDRMLPGLATYVDYKHPKRLATREQLNRITDQLIKLKDCPSFERYGRVIDSILGNSQEVAHIATEPFLREIDEIIDEGLAMMVTR